MNTFDLIEIARAKIQHKDNDDVSINTLGHTRTGERAVVFTVRVSDEISAELIRWHTLEQIKRIASEVSDKEKPLAG